MTNSASFYQSAACPVPAYVPLQTNAADWPCPPAAAIQEINSEISVEFQDGDPSAGTLRCHGDQGSVDLTPQQERAYQALYLIKRLQFDAPLPWTNQSLWTWFTTSVTTIQFLPSAGNDAGGSCCYGPGVMHIAYTPVTQGGFPNEVFIMVHEARHANGYFHDCGGLRDLTISELGALGVQYYLGLWLADHVTTPQLSDKERVYCGLSSELCRTDGAWFCTACGGI